MKRVVLLFVLIATNSCATVYKCGSVYSQSSCGANSSEIQFERHAVPHAEEKRTFQSTSSTSVTASSTVIFGKVIRVADGDTITILTSGGKEKFVLLKLTRLKRRILAAHHNLTGKKQARIYDNLSQKRSTC